VVFVELVDFEVELSFLSPTLGRMPADANFVEFVALPTMVLFFVDKPFLMSFVWFFKDLVDKPSLEFFLFFGTSSSSTDSKILLPLRTNSPFRDSDSAHTHNSDAAAKRIKTRKSTNTFVGLKFTGGAIAELWVEILFSTEYEE